VNSAWNADGRASWEGLALREFGRIPLRCKNNYLHNSPAYSTAATVSPEARARESVSRTRTRRIPTATFTTSVRVVRLERALENSVFRTFPEDSKEVKPCTHVGISRNGTRFFFLSQVSWIDCFHVFTWFPLVRDCNIKSLTLDQCDLVFLFSLLDSGRFCPRFVHEIFWPDEQYRSIGGETFTNRSVR